METENKRGRGRPRKTPAPETTTPPVETPPAVNSAPVKRGRGRPPLSAEEKKKRREERELMGINGGKGVLAPPNVEPGDNARYLAHAMVIMNQPKIDISDPVQVEERIDWYLNHCVCNDMKPTVKGFCNALGVPRSTVWRWKTGQFRPGTHEEIIVRAYDLLEEMWENYMQNGKINPMAGVFLGVNNFGYRDVKQVNVTPVVNDQQETVDVATIEAKYAELPDSED